MDTSVEAMDVDTSADFYTFEDLFSNDRTENNRIKRDHSNILPDPKDNGASGFLNDLEEYKRIKLKKNERAKRFGLASKTKACTDEDIEEYYASIGVSEGNEEADSWRLNAVHMRGIDGMRTRDVLEYFKEYTPVSVEWINENSCNVVLLDDDSAIRALLDLSKKIIGLKRFENSIKVEDDTDTFHNGKRHGNGDFIHVKDIQFPVPSGHWRKGNVYQHFKNILLRFATTNDKQDTNYRDLNEILADSRKRGHKESRKRKLKKEDKEARNGAASKNPWGSLSQNWGVNDKVEEYFEPRERQPVRAREYLEDDDDYDLPEIVPVEGPSIKERLGFKGRLMTDPVELSESEESESDSDEEWCKKSKKLRMRMHADDEEVKVQKRRDKIKNKAKTENVDLRSRLVATKPPQKYREAIQVIVTNPLAKQYSHPIEVSEEDDSEDEERTVEEEEEGEINDSESKDEEEEENESESESSSDDDDEEEEEEEDEDEDDESSDESVITTKEVQGPRGSVIKVVPPKPRLASTVWARLNTNGDSKQTKKDDRYYPVHDLRKNLKSKDIRSRLGNSSVRGRSPLRIEVKNEKYRNRK